MDWNNFYLATAGAAATLIGLLFIAVQFNIDAFVDDPSNRWRAIAGSTFAIYTTLFFLPLFLLIPNLDSAARAGGIFVVVLFGILRVTQTWLPVGRAVFQRRGERAVQTVWLLVGPLLAYAALASAAYDVARGDLNDALQQTIAFVIMGLFAIALRNSWNLLVELTYERKQQSKKIA